MRRFAPPDVLAAADQIGATLNLIAGERTPRRAPELLDLLLLRALDRNETSAAALEDEIADVDDARAVRWAWRHASSVYGYAQLKVLGLLPGVGMSARTVGGGVSVSLGRGLLELDLRAGSGSDLQDTQH